MQRNSSIELFRILSMFLVLIVHFNGWLLGGLPEVFDQNNLSVFRVVQALIQSFSIVCVNCFILITGYFGVSLKLTKIYSLFIMLLFIRVPFYIITSVYNDSFNVVELAQSILVFSHSGYFIENYFMLMFLSPILNSFIDKTSSRILGVYVFTFIGLEFWFACLLQDNRIGFNHGYSVVHFMLIYLLGRFLYVKRYQLCNVCRLYFFIGYIFCSALIFFIYYFGVVWAFDYSNPIVILSSAFLFLIFAKSEFHSKFINYVGSSVLAVYVIHTMLSGKLMAVDKYLLNTYSYGSYLIIVMLLIILIFTLCIMCDKLRILIFSKYTDSLLKYLTNLEYKMKYNG